MNEATRELFEFVTPNWEAKDCEAIERKIKTLIDNGADINAVNEKGLNVLQVILWVDSPEKSYTSTISDDCGYVDESAFFVDACLRNGFQCSPLELTDLLKEYCRSEYELEPGDLKLICTLLEMGADWNCKNEVPLLETILRSDIQWACNDLGSYTDNNLIDWRYKMLCAYYDAGGDLYIKNKNGKYVWECRYLPLTVLAFLLEHGVDVPAETVKSTLKNSDHNGESSVYDHVLEIDMYSLGYIFYYPSETQRYRSIINTLVDKSEKYPFIFQILACVFPGSLYMEDSPPSKPDFYKPAEIYLQVVKEKYGDLSKVIDGVIASCHEEGGFVCFGDFFKFVYSRYPEITDYFPWKKLNVGDWNYLLNYYPQFADKCGFWTEPLNDGMYIIDGFDSFEDLICPETIPYIPLEKCHVNAWFQVLLCQPQLADKCDKLNELSKEQWDELLFEHPELEKYRK